MKFIILLVAFISLSPMATHAGGNFGPGPFRNGSPLQSGTDGVYQAVATGTNVVGLFSWTIAGGTQTTGGNQWVFFVDGNIHTGSTAANISNGKVAGVLDNGISGAAQASANQKLTLPSIYIVPGNGVAGMFQGKIDLKSSVAAFSGSGRLQGTPARTDQLVYIWDITDYAGGGMPDPVIVTPVNIPGNNLGMTTFHFRGTRLSTNTSSTFSYSSSTTNNLTN